MARRAPILWWVLPLAAVSLGFGPCGPIPGGALRGERVSTPVADWSLANEVPRCELEVRPEAPRSMTVNCMAWEGRLFVSCSQCARKRWAAMVEADARGRVRVGDRIHPVTLERVTDPSLLQAVWSARSRKLGQDDSTPPKDGWWTFELVSRGADVEAGGR
jgi:hypothetical protein